MRGFVIADAFSDLLGNGRPPLPDFGEQVVERDRATRFAGAPPRAADPAFSIRAGAAVCRSRDRPKIDAFEVGAEMDPKNAGERHRIGSFNPDALVQTAGSQQS